MTSTVHALFSDSVARWADHPFIHIPFESARAYSSSDIDWTYGQAGEQVTKLAQRYAAGGLKARHRVAIMLGNRADFFLHYLAFNSLGVSVVPLNAEASPVEIVHVLRDSRSVLVLALPQFHTLVRQALDLLDIPLTLTELDGPVSLSSIRDAVPAAGVDEAALLYTSGSTGEPKGCMLSNAYMLAMGRWYRNVGGLCAMTDGQERLITPLPLVHMNALAASSMVMMMCGGCIIQLDRFHPSAWWDTVRASRATIVHYLGVMPAILLQLEFAANDRHHLLKFGFGAGVHPKHHSAFEERFGFPLVESWSMTEVGGGGAIIAATEPRHVGERCFGRPGDFMEYRIVDDNNQDVPLGNIGELWVRAAGDDPRAGFFSGYANQPALTEAGWLHGYFHTGDLVRCGPDGALYFVDRKKSIIRRSGENISSLEVEAVLNQLPEVKNVGVGPVDDEIRGEEVMACIQIDPGVSASEETALAIFYACAQRLVYFKVPGYIAFVSELPLTVSQKLQRGQLKTQSQAMVDSGEVFDLRHHKKKARVIS